jgi:hypothetical protein
MTLPFNGVPVGTYTGVCMQIILYLRDDDLVHAGQRVSKRHGTSVYSLGPRGTQTMDERLIMLIMHGSLVRLGSWVRHDWFT